MLTVATALGFVALAILVACEVSVYRDLARAHQDAARFPLFAVRDQLVQLVADGVMNEDEPAWQHAYRSVNQLLDIRNTMDIWDFVKSILDHQMQMREDALLRDEFNAFVVEQEQASQRCPTYADVLVSYDAAVQYMVRKRSSVFTLVRVVVHVLPVYAKLRFHKFKSDVQLSSSELIGFTSMRGGRANCSA